MTDSAKPNQSLYIKLFQILMAICICVKLCLQHGGLCIVSHIITQLISAYFYVMEPITN